MQVSLSKYHGLENDFLVYDLAQGTPETSWPELARRWCARSTGIGADGLLLLDVVNPGTFTMRLYNADGSVAEMSGNGIRCLVFAAHRMVGGTAGAEYEVRTDSGTRVVTVVDREDYDTVHIRVDMGEVADLPEPDGWAALECDPMRPVSHVSLGNPHSVVAVEDVSLIDLERLGKLVPQVNLEIIEPGPGSNAITMRVHERGAGITRACGTGACAAAHAALKWGVVPSATKEVVVHMDGGVARVHIDDRNVATLTGPATHVGSITVHA